MQEGRGDAGGTYCIVDLNASTLPLSSPPPPSPLAARRVCIPYESLRCTEAAIRPERQLTLKVRLIKVTLGQVRLGYTYG